jgi:SAM-dependent methyltransferase
LSNDTELTALAEVQPFQREGSNSFNFVPEEVIGKVDDLASCPIRVGDRSAPEASSRHLLFHHGGRLARLVTDSGDFGDVQLRDTVEDLGQVYLDVSAKLLLDDFERDLRPVGRDPSCQECPQRGPCPGAFSVQARPESFSSSERRLSELLRAISGRVLDVGVGEPFSLARAFAGEAVPEDVEFPFTYVGIEPDEERVFDLEQRFPWMNVRVAGAEDERLIEWFGDERDQFDHILLLRSYNHLKDLVRSFRNLVRILKPGGTLLIVENTVYGLIRGRKKMLNLQQLEDDGGAPFEHYRNHTSHEAVAVLAGLGLELKEHSSVGPETANQWILRLIKTDTGSP